MYVFWFPLLMAYFWNYIIICFFCCIPVMTILKCYSWLPYMVFPFFAIICNIFRSASSRNHLEFLECVAFLKNQYFFDVCARWSKLFLLSPGLYLSTLRVKGSIISTNLQILTDWIWSSVLGHLGSSNKVQWTRYLMNNRNLFLVVVELESTQPRYQQMRCLVRAHFLINSSSGCGHINEGAS